LPLFHYFIIYCCQIIAIISFTPPDIDYADISHYCHYSYYAITFMPLLLILFIISKILLLSLFLQIRHCFHISLMPTPFLLRHFISPLRHFITLAIISSCFYFFRFRRFLSAFRRHFERYTPDAILRRQIYAIDGRLSLPLRFHCRQIRQLAISQPPLSRGRWLLISQLPLLFIIDSFH